MRRLLMTLFVAAGLGAGCSASDIRTLAPAEFKAAAASDSTAVVLDVRQPQEYAAGHLAGAVALDYLDSDAFANGVKKLDKSRTYYVYCRSGRRSHSAAEQMQKAGLKVVDMRGGILEWEADGLPVVR